MTVYRLRYFRRSGTHDSPILGSSLDAAVRAAYGVLDAPGSWATRPYRIDIVDATTGEPVKTGLRPSTEIDPDPFAGPVQGDTAGPAAPDNTPDSAEAWVDPGPPPGGQ